MRRTGIVLLLACLAVAAVVGLASCSGTSTAPPATGSNGATSSGNAVTISDFQFSPAALDVKLGTSVTWTNQDSAPHTVVADDGSFKSPNLATGKSFTQPFDKAGTYKYHCGIHPAMVGQIVVK